MSEHLTQIIADFCDHHCLTRCALSCRPCARLQHLIDVRASLADKAKQIDAMNLEMVRIAANRDKRIETLEAKLAKYRAAFGRANEWWTQADKGDEPSAADVIRIVQEAVDFDKGVTNGQRNDDGTGAAADQTSPGTEPAL